jgi:hypothetical protein
MGCGTLAGLALAGTGAGLQAGASASENSKMNSAVGAELARQNQFSNQAKDVFNQSLGQSTPQSAQQQIQQGAQQSLGTLASIPGAQFSLPQPVGGTNAGNTAGTNAQGVLNVNSNNANAGLQGYGNFPLQQYLKDLQAKNQLGVINNNAQGWANILPYQLQNAATSSQGLSDIGSLLGAIGGPLTAYSMMGSAPSISSIIGNDQLNWLGALAKQGVFPASQALPAVEYSFPTA